MSRGDLVTVAMPGDYGKPRPALVIQADRFEHIGSVAILLITSTIIDAPLIRVVVQPSSTNGLRKLSQVMIDKPMSVKRDKLSPAFGQLDDETMLSVSRSLAVFLGIAA